MRVGGFSGLGIFGVEIALGISPGKITIEETVRGWGGEESALKTIVNVVLVRNCY